MRKRVVALCVLLVAFSFGCSPEKESGAEVGDVAPGFVLKDVDNREVRLADYKNKEAVHLVFWATWCPYCPDDMENLRDAYKRLQKKGVAVLAINVGLNDSVEKARRFREKHKLPYPVLFDQQGIVSGSYGVLGVPTNITVDKEGIVKHRLTGARSDIVQVLDRFEP
jgi:peroxiredoxin